MKFIKSALILSVAVTALNAQADGSVEHSGKASKHSVLAVAHGVTSTAKVASAVVATPLIAAGGLSLAAGSASVELGSKIADSRISRGPLVITDMTVTVDPAPNQVIIIQNNQAKKNN